MVVVGRNIGWLAGGDLAVKAGLFACGVIVARGFGPAVMGLFTVAFGAALVLMLALAAGQPEVLIREVAKQPASGRALGRLAASWQRRLALVVVPVAVAAALPVPVAELRWTLLAFLPYAWLRCRIATIGAVFKGLDRMEVEVLARTAEVTIALCLLALATLLRGPSWLVGVAFGVGGLVGLLIAARKRRCLPDVPATVTRRWLAREGLGFLGLGLAGQLLAQVDSFALASLGFAAAQIGYYGVARTPALGLLTGIVMVAVALYPTLSRHAATARLTPTRVLALGFAGMGIGGVLGAGLFVVREPLVRLVFGNQYEPALPLLAVLVWLLPAAGTTVLLGVAVAALGRQTWALAWQVAAVLLAVGAYLVVVPRHGLSGCAWVTVAMQWLGVAVVLPLALFAASQPEIGAATPPPRERQW